MARAPEIPQDVLQRLAGQIASRATNHMFSAVLANQSVGIAESFPIYTLTLEALQDHERSFKSMLIETGTWHHQIRHGQIAKEFARSVAGKTTNEWNIAELNRSPLAQKVEETIHWIDGNFNEDVIVRMLVVPAYYFTGFWLENRARDLVVVIDAPSQLAFRPKEAYDAVQFLTVLRDHRPASGARSD